MELLGLSDQTTHASYTFNGNDGLPWVSFLIHFGFAIFFAVLYCLIAEVYPGVKLWQEHLSEIPGHAIWMWVIEVFRRDLRNRITGQPDPEVAGVAR